MATQQKTVDAMLDHFSVTLQVSARKMFGEYALYCDGKVVALVCDDQLFVKPTQGGRVYIGKAVEAAPYPGAKPSFLIGRDLWEDSGWMSELIRITASELPAPKMKKSAKP